MLKVLWNSIIIARFTVFNTFGIYLGFFSFLVWKKIFLDFLLFCWKQSSFTFYHFNSSIFISVIYFSFFPIFFLLIKIVYLSWCFYFFKFVILNYFKLLIMTHHMNCELCCLLAAFSNFTLCDSVWNWFIAFRNSIDHFCWAELFFVWNH